jgi:cation transport ATPase
MVVHCAFQYFIITLSHNAVNVIPDILFDGLRAFKQGAPNMNSLVGFGSAAAFAISAVSELIEAVFSVQTRRNTKTHVFI